MNPLRVTCPHCRAIVGQHCTIPGTRITFWSAHPSRHDVARAAYYARHEQHQ